jgi:putative transposase
MFQRCSRDNEIGEKDISVKVHKCECGLEIGRDVNPKINIKHDGLKQLDIERIA